MDSDGDAVPYHELLGLARDEGLIALDVHVIQVPDEANGRSAVVQATARTREGGFSAVGEASTASAPPDWQPFLVTLAELRAKARALRELTGLEHMVREELSTPYLPADMPAEPPTGPGSRQQAPHTGAAGGRAFPDRPEGNGAASRPALRPTSPSTVASPRGEATGAANGADQETHPGDEVTAPHPTVVPSPAPPQPTAARDEPEGEGIDREMEAKLLKLASSIATMEGTDLSDAEARQKLDDFFVRAFKHPLSRATRIEGQRVVQRLSSELSRLRAASHDAKA